MSRYLVFEPSEGLGPTGEAVFVRDRFSFFAFFFTFLWMFRHGLWLWGVGTIALLVAINSLGAVEGLEISAALISLLVSVLIGLEGPSLRASKLRRKGWSDVAAFEAENTDEAELIYYHSGPIDTETPVAPEPTDARAAPLQPDEIPADPADDPVRGASGAETNDVSEPDAAEVEDPPAPARARNSGNENTAVDVIPLPSPDHRAAREEVDPDERLRAEIERTAKVEGWAERWDKPGAEFANVSGGRRRPVGRL